MRNVLLFVHPATPLILWGLTNSGELLNSLGVLPEGWGGESGWVGTAAEPGEPGRALGALDLADGDDDAAPERRLQAEVTRISRYASPIVTLFFSVVINLLCAYFYKSGITDKRKEWRTPPAGTDLAFATGAWKYSTFSCFDDINYCLYGCCCLTARVADTYQAANVGTYWPTVLFILVMLIGMQVAQFVFVLIMGWLGMSNIQVPIFYWLVGIILACWFSTKRQQMKEKMGGTTADVFNDFICWWCCSCCTAIQEARQVDEVNGVITTCCFKYNEDQQGMAGHPISAGGQPVVMGSAVNG